MAAIKIIQLISIKVAGIWYYYQQYQIEPLKYQGKEYQYLAFDMQSSQNSLDIDSSGGGSFKILYTDLLASAIEENNGLRNAPLVHTMFRGSLTGDRLREHYTIESTSIDDEENAIFISLRPGLNGINGQIPGALITREIFGALPTRNSVGI